MAKSTSEVDLIDSPKEIAVTAKPVYVGDDLHLDVWVRAKLGHPKSILVRSINEAGEVRTAFLHIDEEVRVIPTFSNDVELTPPNSPTPASPKRSRRMKRAKGAKRNTRRNFGILRFFEYLSTALAVGVLALFLTGVIQAKVVLTGSMKPTINPGDVVVAASTKFKEPKIGDVAFYAARDLQNKAVTTWAHRIIAGDSKTGFQFKGDANAAADIHTVSLSDISAVELFKIPAIGRYLNPWSILLTGSGLILLAYSIRLIRK
jgi:signal peptidase I